MRRFIVVVLAAVRVPPLLSRQAGQQMPVASERRWILISVVSRLFWETLTAEVF